MPEKWGWTDVPLLFWELVQTNEVAFRLVAEAKGKLVPSQIVASVPAKTVINFESVIFITSVTTKLQLAFEDVLEAVTVKNT